MIRLLEYNEDDVAATAAIRDGLRINHLRKALRDSVIPAAWA